MAKLDETLMERIPFSWFDTLDAHAFDGTHDRLTAFSELNLGKPTRCNIDKAATIVADPRDSTCAINRICFGAPTPAIKTWDRAQWSLIIAQKIHDARGMWYPPDAVEDLAALEKRGVKFSEKTTPLDWTFLCFEMKQPVVLGPLQGFQVMVQRFGNPYGELKVVLDTIMTRPLS